MNSNTVELLLHLVPGDAVPISKQIGRQLRDRIVRGEISAGELLPAHRQVARNHRVSPSSVETAYQELIDEGLIEAGTRDKIRVTELDSELRRDMVERLQLETLVARELGRRELEMARSVQQRLLPPTEVKGPRWTVVSRCQAARVVAGDFYDVLHRPDGGVDVVVADVAGKGFAASLIMASVKAMLPFVAAEDSAAQALTALNARLAGELGRGEFVALTMARFDPQKGILELANGGAPDPYLLRRSQPLQSLSVTGPRLPIGIRHNVTYASRTFELAESDALLMLTDGLPEARLADGDPLGYEALETMLARSPVSHPPAAWLDAFFDAVQQQSERLPDDDWTALLLLPRPGDGET